MYIWIGASVLGLCILWVFYAQWRARQPWPDFGGAITPLKTVAQWEDLVAQATEDSKLIVVDVFALWCPPCRRAAPTFARMSEEYSGTIFAKVNVDEAGELSHLLGARVLPTFKIFRASPVSPVVCIGAPREGGLQELASIRGWDERQLRYELEGAGATRDA